MLAIDAIDTDCSLCSPGSLVTLPTTPSAICPAPFSTEPSSLWILEEVWTCSHLRVTSKNHQSWLLHSFLASPCSEAEGRASRNG